MTTYKYSCHCRAIQGEFRTELPATQWKLRSCTCTFCRRHGGSGVSDPAGSMTVDAVEASCLKRYRFGTGTAGCILCSRCGVLVAVVYDSGSGVLGVVNANTIEPEPQGMPPSVRVSFDDETLENRLERRKRTWTPVFGRIGNGNY